MPQIESALHLLAPITEVYTASHVGLLDNHTAAYRAGSVKGGLTEPGTVTSRSAEKVSGRVPASLGGHLLKGRLHGVKKGLPLTIGECANLSLRVNPGLVEDVLQDTIAQARYSLLGGQECLGTEFLDLGRSNETVEVYPVKLV